MQTFRHCEQIFPDLPSSPVLESFLVVFFFFLFSFFPLPPQFFSCLDFCLWFLFFFLFFFFLKLHKVAFVNCGWLLLRSAYFPTPLAAPSLRFSSKCTAPLLCNMWSWPVLLKEHPLHNRSKKTNVCFCPKKCMGFNSSIPEALT